MNVIVCMNTWPENPGMMGGGKWHPLGQLWGLQTKCMLCAICPFLAMRARSHITSRQPQMPADGLDGLLVYQATTVFLFLLSTVQRDHVSQKAFSIRTPRLLTVPVMQVRPRRVSTAAVGVFQHVSRVRSSNRVNSIKSNQWGI